MGTATLSTMTTPLNTTEVAHLESGLPSASTPSTLDVYLGGVRADCLERQQ